MACRSTQMDFSACGRGGKDFGLCQEVLEVSRNCPAFGAPADFLSTCLTSAVTADFQL